MKQLIVVLLILGGGFYLYNNGFLNVIKQQIGVNSDAFMGSAKSALSVFNSGLPEKESTRAGGLKGSPDNVKLVEKTIFDTYDSDACYAYIEVAYANGVDGVEDAINKYLAAFNTPSAKAKLLNMLLKYKDRQTLYILRNFFLKGTFARKMLLHKMADFKSYEVAQIMQEAMKDPNPSVAAEAKLINDEISTQSWYQSPNAQKTDSGKIPLAGKQIQEALAAPLGK